MKRLFTIVLSVLILLPSFGSLFVYATFKINQKEIAKTICVQRKSVFNTCNGRCELQKSIKKYADNEREMQDNLKDKLEVVYIQNKEMVFSSIPLIESKQKSSNLIDKKPIKASNLTFRPPVYFV